MGRSFVVFWGGVCFLFGVLGGGVVGVFVVFKSERTTQSILRNESKTVVASSGEGGGKKVKGLFGSSRAWKGTKQQWVGRGR